MLFEFGTGLFLDGAGLFLEFLAEVLDGFPGFGGLFIDLGAEVVQIVLEVFVAVLGGTTDAGAGLPALVGRVKHADGSAGGQA